MAVAAWILIATAKLVWDAHYFDGYDPSLPLNAEIISEEDRGDYHRVYFAYEACPGRRVPALLALPTEGAPPFPVLVFLHGIGQEKEFVDEIASAFTRKGFAITSFDQYMQGERDLDDASWAEEGLALRRRGAMTVNEARRLADYLETREDIDKDRMYLAGASYGAITGATAAAFDKRFKAAMLIYGGGDFSKLVSNREVDSAIGPLMNPIASFVGWFMGPCDPVRYVAGIAPRPVLFQNGERDRIITPAAARALQNAALEPKDVLWYPSDHPDLDPEYIPIVLEDGLEWIIEQDARICADSTG